MANHSNYGEMKTMNKSITINRGLYSSIILLFLFVTMISGCFAFYTQSYVRATLFLLTPPIWIYLLFAQRVHRKILNQRTPAVNFMVFMMILVLVGFSELTSLFDRPVVVTPGTYYTTIFSIGYLIGGIIVLWQFWQAYRKG